MPETRNTSRDRAVVLAIQMRGQGVYKLGAGNGDKPMVGTPLEHGACDCSNFVNWCLGNVLSGKVYSNTDGIIRDAYGLRTDGKQESPRNEVWSPVPKETAPWPGDLIVSPGEYEMVGGKPQRKRPGHVGIIVQVLPEFRRSDSFADVGHRLLRVVHCALNRGVPPAIRETDAAPWRSRGYLVRYRGFVGGWKPALFGAARPTSSPAWIHRCGSACVILQTTACRRSAFDARFRPVRQATA